jgi:uncharacterized protein (DUF362 family)
MAHEPEKDMSRRIFLARSAKAGLSLAAACAFGFGFYDRRGPGSRTEGDGGVEFRDFSVAGLPPRMGLVRGSDRRKLLRAGVETIGGISRFIRKGDRVVLKVNAAFAMPAMLSATTHPDLVSEMVRMCFEAGAASVVVTDNPINDPASCFRLTGIEAVVRGEGASLMTPSPSLFRPLLLAGAGLIQGWPVLHGPFAQADRVIGLAPVKDHHRSGASMCMKNWYGVLGGRRNLLHQDIHTTIKELAMMVRPTFVVLDGVTSMMRNGPTGGALSDLKQTDTLIVCTDQVAADAFGATLLDRRPQDLPYIEKAEKAGLGTANWQSLNPVSVSVG